MKRWRAWSGRQRKKSWRSEWVWVWAGERGGLYCEHVYSMRLRVGGEGRP